MRTTSKSKRTPKRRHTKAPAETTATASTINSPARLETRRAYTVALHGTPDGMRALSETHRVMNLGADVFCNWLLTLGGGLPLSQPDEAVLTTLAWLTVETNAPANAPVLEPQRIAVRLEHLFAERLGAADSVTEEVFSVCHQALTANIRDGAARIDRAQLFDELCETLGLVDSALAREDAHTVWESLFQKATLSLNINNDGSSVRGAASGAGQRTSHLFSHLFGTSEAYGKQRTPADAGAADPTTPVKRYRLHYRDVWQKYLTTLLTESTGMKPGRDSAGPSNGNGRVYSAGAHLREMFFVAAERIAAYRSRLRRQEATRLALIFAAQSYSEAQRTSGAADVYELLDTMRAERSAETLSRDLYLPGKRSLRGWPQLVTAWQNTSEEKERREIVSSFISRTNPREAGDPALFLKLAEDRFLSVWRAQDGSLRPELLPRCVEGWQLRADITRLKLPAFCHIDPSIHPVYARFGVSRPSMKLEIVRNNGHAPTMRVELALWDGTHVRRFGFSAASDRIKRELLPDGHNTKDQPSRRTLLAERARECSIGEGATACGDEVSELNALDMIFAEQVGATLKATTQQSKPANFTRWQLILALQLMPRGPWVSLARKLGDGPIVCDKSSNQLRIAPMNSVSGRFRGLAFPFTRSDLKVGFGGELSGIPGLRVLGVDIRQAYGAALALWETLTQRDYELCLETARQAGRSVEVHELYSSIERVGLFRRIADPKSPAPWARLVYQRLLKLPGERRGDIRRVTRDELIELNALAMLIDLPTFEQPLLVSQALVTACEGVRHFIGQQARLALLTAKLSGGHRPHTWLAQAKRFGLSIGDQPPDPTAVIDALAALWTERDRKAQQALRLLALLIEGRRPFLRGRRKGGLSLAAIQLRELLYRTQRSFACRPTPLLPKGASPSDSFAVRLRNKILRIKRERARVLANAIVRTALGLDKRGSATFPFAHAVIIEDLTDIGPRAANTRDMNERLIRWAAGAVRDRLVESCQLHGLHLRMEEAAYTSRQDPQTGKPGLRCVEVNEHAFISTWQQEYERSVERLNTRQETAQDRVVCTLWKRINDRGPLSGRSVLVPAARGRLLVILNSDSRPTKRHVALTAAANIGLSAILDPHLPSARWRVAAVWDDAKQLYVAAKTRDRADGALLAEWAVRGVSTSGSLTTGGMNGSKPDLRSNNTRVVNLWRDPSALPLHEGEWLPTPEYWDLHEHRIATALAGDSQVSATL